jgi:hypothetical protein
VVVDDEICRMPMRVARTEVSQCNGPSIGYGEYFRGISEVIGRDGFRQFTEAVAAKLGKEVSLGQIGGISIYSEKHGSDYHPARIEVTLQDQGCSSFVMNVAVTKRGRDRLWREYQVLQYLNQKYDFSFLPSTYFLGEACHPPMVMFLGDWFEGYEEFHLSIDPGGFQGLVIWRAHGRRRPLARSQARHVYCLAAKILTLYYDIFTFEQIFPWHHAAGDFVVKEQPASIDVRLVTARQYASMMGGSNGVSVHEALLFFLLNLSLRMRLDRLDGTGAVAWADDGCVDATMEGFWKGLKIKEERRFVAPGFNSLFTDYLRHLSEEDLLERFRLLVDACDPSAPDIPVIRRRLEEHAFHLYATLQRDLFLKERP